MCVACRASSGGAALTAIALAQAIGIPEGLSRQQATGVAKELFAL
ncbi:hypothetical protein [Scytonema sp. HK-05]|nr:hypothetical protein [Scytonema sp. HK-05]